jgi:hypothetical protein
MTKHRMDAILIWPRLHGLLTVSIREVREGGARSACAIRAQLPKPTRKTKSKFMAVRVVAPAEPTQALPSMTRNPSVAPTAATDSQPASEQ